VKRYILYAFIILGSTAISGAIWQWYHPKTVNTHTWFTVKEVKHVDKIRRVMVPGPKEVQVIEKEKIVKELILPAWIANDPNKQIIATAEVPAYKGKTDVVASLDLTSGKSDMLIKQKPIPFFSLDSELAIGAGYGISSDKGQMVEVHGRYTFLRLGNVYIQGYGEVAAGTRADKQPEARALIQAEYRR